jgi:hypothetical protein
VVHQGTVGEVAYIAIPHIVEIALKFERESCSSALSIVAGLQQV